MTADKFEIHHRLQLSALLDGELPADEARFLMRRLQHDSELNAQWERWQLLGDAMRGKALAPAPEGFADRVARAVAQEGNAHAATSRTRAGVLRWGGGALAAACAALAVFVAMPSHQSAQQTQVAPAPAVAAASAASPKSAPVETPIAKQAIAPALREVAQVSVPRAAVEHPHRAPQTVAPVEPVSAPASTLVAEASAPTPDPFAAPDLQAHAVAKPWPRSLLQPSRNTFNASFDSLGEPNPAHPFAPQTPLQVPPAEPMR